MRLPSMVTFVVLVLSLLSTPLSADAIPFSGTIDLPNGVLGTAHGTNDRGDIVGSFVPTDLFPQFLGFLLEKDGTFAEIGPSFGSPVPGDPPLLVRDNAIAIDINDRGDIIGNWFPFISAEPNFAGFLYQDGEYLPIIFPNISIPHCADRTTRLFSISNNGDIMGAFQFGNLFFPCPIGTVAGTFLWRDGVFYTNDVPGFPPIPAPNGGLMTFVVAAGAGWFMVRRRSGRVKSA